MATKSVTKATPFHEVREGSIFEVRAGLDAHTVQWLASILTTHVREALEVAVQDKMDADDAFIMTFLLDTARALYRSTGVEA